MTQSQTSTRIHPLVAGAAISVILVSMVGVAAITGLLPTSSSTPASTLPLTASASSVALTPDASTDSNIVKSSSAVVDTQAVPATSHVKPSHKSTNVVSHPAKNYDDSQPVKVAQAPQICDSCGTVESVRAVEHQAEQGSGVGAVAGALLGGVLGNQVGGGNGRKLATVAGAVGGGFAGNSIEKRTNTTTSYEVRVRMENGSTRTFTPSNPPDWRAGDRVKVIDGRLTSRE
jgi:outer membrane lipoprotein SlyB